ncbi:MAG TPA: hypothetical protein DGG95_15135 [Cytophagales bacterium]|jgi:hypothetical protein|nr:hypothetical protein [Cytophagales bacterium]
MGKFKQNKVYMIIDETEITTEMINYSTSKNKKTMPVKSVEGINKRILETSEPVKEIYSSYNWYDADEINSAWEMLESND